MIEDTRIMNVNLEIPEELGRRITADPGDLPRAALEGLALEALRAGKLTVSRARRLLGIPSRYEMDGFLKAHGIFPELTLDDVRRDSDVASLLWDDDAVAESWPVNYLVLIE